MTPGSDPDDQRATHEERPDEPADPARPRPEFRWVQLREPRHAIEIGTNGRVLDSYYHEGYDAWEVLLETDEGESSE